MCASVGLTKSPYSQGSSAQGLRESVSTSIADTLNASPPPLEVPVPSTRCPSLCLLPKGRHHTGQFVKHFVLSSQPWSQRQLCRYCSRHGLDGQSPPGRMALGSSKRQLVDWCPSRKVRHSVTQLHFPFSSCLTFVCVCFL